MWVFRSLLIVVVIFWELFHEAPSKTTMYSLSLFTYIRTYTHGVAPRVHNIGSCKIVTVECMGIET